MNKWAASAASLKGFQAMIKSAAGAASLAAKKSRAPGHGALLLLYFKISLYVMVQLQTLCFSARSFEVNM